MNADCQLSGMPDLKLGLNDKAYYEAQGRTSRSKAIEFNDIKFHQCVRLGRFENERLVTFIPPDGKFELMSYRLDIRVKPLFSVDVAVENPSNTRIRFIVRVKSNYKEKSIANNVDIFVPIPEDVESPQFNTPTGSAVYVPEKNSLKWTIKQFAGHKYLTVDSGNTILVLISNCQPSNLPKGTCTKNSRSASNSRFHFSQCRASKRECFIDLIHWNQL